MNTGLNTRPASFSLVIILTGLLALLSGYVQAAPEYNVVMVIFDGARGTALRDLVAQGRMPVTARLIEEGTLVKNATTILPSTTGPSYAPFVMGLFPWKSLIPGIRWYDRVTGKYRVYCGTDAPKTNDDLTTSFPTIYELMPGDHTLSIFGFIDRGCDEAGMPLLKSMMAKLRKDNDLLDDNLFDTFQKKVRDHFPRFAFLSIHGADGYGHSDGAESEKYYTSMENYDRIMGKIIDLYRELGKLEETVFVITSDHGQRPVSMGRGLQEYLEAKGMRARDSIPRSTVNFNLLKARNGKNYDCMVAVSGNACVQLYFKDHSRGFNSGTSMKSRPEYEQLRKYPVGELKDGKFRQTGSVDLIDELLAHEAVQIVTVREGYRFHIFTLQGHSIITRSGDGYKYAVADGEDPLGYTSHSQAASLVDSGYHNGDQWLQATATSAYPDGVVQFSQFLETPGSGDIILFSKKGYEPWNEGQKGVHGGPERAEMVVPLVFSGPCIAKGKTLPFGRTVDIFPTLLRVLGIQGPDGIDGKVLDLFNDEDLPDADPSALAAFNAARPKAGKGPIDRVSDATGAVQQAVSGAGDKGRQLINGAKEKAASVEDRIRNFLFGK